MALTPNIMMSVEGLLNNTALASVPLDVDTYINQIIVADFTATLAAYQANADATEPDISQATVDAFRASMDSTTPYISNATVSADVTSDNYTQILAATRRELVPSA